MRMGWTVFRHVVGCVVSLGMLALWSCRQGGQASSDRVPAETLDAGPAGDTGGLPPPICHPGARWTPGSQAFTEATSAWGLDKVQAQGVRVSAVDFDGDGWTDLVVRRGGGTPDDFTPGGTRQTWLLRNTGKHGFEDVTVASNIRQNRVATDPTKGRPGDVFAFGDVDNDGDLDVFTGLTRSPNSPETSELLLNQGDGTFKLGPAGSDLRRAAAAGDAVAGASFVDFDRDGFLDLWVVEAGKQQNRLYRGDGTGNFKDVTLERGLETKPWALFSDLNQGLAHTDGWSGAACDLNGDGNPELLATSYARAPNHLWQSDGALPNPRYVNRSVASSYAFDDNMDWTDNESARCWCKLHPTDAGCPGVPPPVYIVCNTDADAFRWDHTTGRQPYQLGGNSGTTFCADIDNDGLMELLTGELAHWDVGQSSDRGEILFNSGEPNVRFIRPGNESTGLARHYSYVGWNEAFLTSAVFDFDADGWPDIYWGGSEYSGQHGLLFHQDRPRHFEPVPIELGIDQHRSHGVAVADFDHDGDLDVVVGHSLSRCEAGDLDPCYPTSQVRFFENQMGGSANFIALSLRGAQGTNRAAIGARVSVTAGGITQMQDIGGGFGHYGAQNDLVLYFGLGPACEADVTVRWPDAKLTKETFHLPAGYRFALTQGKRPVVLTP